MPFHKPSVALVDSSFHYRSFREQEKRQSTERGEVPYSIWPSWPPLSPPFSCIWHADNLSLASTSVPARFIEVGPFSSKPISFESNLLKGEFTELEGTPSCSKHKLSSHHVFPHILHVPVPHSSASAPSFPCRPSCLPSPPSYRFASLRLLRRQDPSFPSVFLWSQWKGCKKPEPIVPWGQERLRRMA